MAIIETQITAVEKNIEDCEGAIKSCKDIELKKLLISNLLLLREEKLLLFKTQQTTGKCI